ncbi:MAG: hypothetical protein KAQ62_25330, partial [Cyclobacteriaceae bacterium]|nr:hypothetical protein [Cyclobacteriaceae bacterium]
MKQSIIYLFWLSTFLYPQTSDLIFQNLSSADGLPGNEISAIFQDHLGFLWFGTDFGLVQYDGYQFEIYQPDDNDPYSISGCSAGQISEDNNGNLWVLIMDDGRINKFNRKTKKFNRFMPDPGDSTSPRYKGIFQFYLDSAGDLWTVTFEGKLDKINTETGDIKHYHDILNDTTNLSSSIVSAYAVGGLRRSALYEDSEGMMWIGTSGSGLYRYHRESDSFFNYKHDPGDPYSISCDSVSSIFEDSQKNIWICTQGGGLNRYSRKTNRFTHYRHRTDDPLTIGSDFCYKILEDKSKNLWVALENGLDCFDQKNGVFTHHYRHDPKDPNSPGRDNRFLPVYEDKTGFIWILVQGRHNQIDRYDPQTGRTFNYLEDYNNPKSIIGSQFLSFFEDHFGSFWMGTMNRGAIKFDPLIQNFKNYKHNPGNNNSLSHNQINAIIESKSQPGVIWIGTPDGLNKYDKGTETFTHYRHDPNNSNSLINNHIMSLIEDESGLLWIGTKPVGFSSYDPHTGRFKHYNYSPEYSIKKLVGKLFQDHSGTIWLAEIGRGLTRFDKDLSTFTRHMLNRQVLKSWHNSVQYMYEDKEGSLWISTVAGLKKYLRQQQTFTHTLLKNFIRAIYEDSSNQLWLASIDNGLALFDRMSGEVTYYNQNHGLVNNEVRSIIEDDHGNLWLTTAGGLSSFNTQTRTFTNFNTQHGLPSNIFQVRTGIKTSDGEILVGTLDNGMVAFNPDDIEINTIPPKLVISDIKLFNKSLA